MTGVIRSEVLRAVSAPTFLAILALMIMVPAIILTSAGDLDGILALGSDGATKRVFEPVAWAFVTAAFVGANTVTREYYYHSIEPSVVTAGFPRLFWAKAIAGSIVGLALGIVVSAIWLVVTFVVLSGDGIAMRLDGGIWATAGGALAATVIGGTMGAALGWIVRNYYIGAALVLAVPIGLEYAMARAEMDVARFMPGMSLAALGGPTSRGEMLPFGSGLGVAVAWAAVLLGIGYLLARRRFR